MGNVWCFFWDERDGPEQCGWWFAPAVGSDRYYAFNPMKSATPPLVGWKVNISGPVDASMRIMPGGQQNLPPQPPQQPRPMQQQQQQQQQQQMHQQQQQQGLW